MLSRRKHILSGILLCIFCYSTCLSGLLLNLRLAVHRTHAQSPHSSVTIQDKITIPAKLVETLNSTFQWTGENEFRYCGKMYDVTDFLKVNGNWIFTCENDTMEETLISLLDTGEEDNTQVPPTKKCDKASAEFLPAAHEIYYPAVDRFVTSGIERELPRAPFSPVNEPPPWLN